MATLQAVLDQLLSVGYDGLSVAEVARSAGVGPATIYRRWPTKAELAAAALAEFAATTNPIPDTGSLESDLRTLLSQIMALLRRPEVARLIRAAAAIGPGPGGDAAAQAAFWETRYAGSADIIDRAIARGELLEDTRAERVIEHLVGPAFLRLLLTGRPLDDELLDDSVRRTLAAYTT